MEKLKDFKSVPTEHKTLSLICGGIENDLQLKLAQNRLVNVKFLFEHIKYDVCHV